MNKVLQLPELDFKTTTHYCTMCTAKFEGKQVYLLRQVDDFALACTNQQLADRIYDTIRQKLQLPNEDKPPFAKMGLINNFNGTDVLQTDSYIKIFCAKYYIESLVSTHGWKGRVPVLGHSKTTNFNHVCVCTLCMRTPDKKLDQRTVEFVSL